MLGFIIARLIRRVSLIVLICVVEAPADKTQQNHGNRHQGNAVTFTTSEMASAAAACSPASGQIVLGLLTRSTETVPGNGGMVAAIDGYTYQYRAPQATCGAGDALEGQAVPNISASLKSLEAVK